MQSYENNNADAVECASRAANRIGLVQRLSRRYLFVLAAVVFLVVVDQAVVQPLLARMSSFAPVINVAGRQRMLSQKLTKSALALRAAEDQATTQARRRELGETLAAWEAANTALQNGDASRDIVKIDIPMLRSEWQLIGSHFDAMCAAADQIIQSGDHAGAAQLRSATNTIVDHEEQFLMSMDRIVSLMEREAAKSVARLRICAAAIAATIILLLIGLGWFVIWPATQNIRGQVDVLEAAVAIRTRELSDALLALRHEVKRREAADQKLQRLTLQLAHADRVFSLGHLAGGLAHELNQPLATIANYTEACDLELARMPSSDQTDRLGEHLKRAKQAALRAGKIVGRMRSFVRLDSANVTQANINDLIREVLELCQAEIAKAGVELLAGLPSESAVVECDAIQIQQVLVNLIQNALQAMRDIPQDQRRLEISGAVADDSIQVAVADSGPGFVSTDTGTVFAPFHTSKSDGLGIGLAICRSIIEQHGGSIWVESPRGCGARVIFSMPLVKSYADTRSELAECVCR
jgi:C4-dicarboxylate-specific signal transduction histidine kinase